jgi:uncharacterized protein (UPF0335 family)
MDDGVNIRKAIERYSVEISTIERQRDEIMNKLSELAYKRDILQKAMEVLESSPAPETFFIEVPTPEAIMKETGKGMTATTIKILKHEGKLLSVKEVLQKLEKEGYKTKRVNVYVMLKRLVEKKTIRAEKEDGLIKYGTINKPEGELIY